ncbi:patatin family protein [Paenibacillus psychroresistens]|uniref:Patatin family protein n=1 Tax=Paenibacillus psychroresistens TaxID=1778678 RepID=A0A6B8RSJ7_9BACL|nr:patatin family protein [Paenibacillus psychroresistens]QGQ98535.1 patatin family protein [Paenibacillus psychroresistens]
MNGVGLVLQGGGMRGVYTAGVLDYYMEQRLYFPYVAAVSAGACNASAYLARQKGLGRNMHINYLHDHRYISYRNLWRGKSILGLDYIFDELPYTLEPFHFEAFQHAKEIFKVGVTNCASGCCMFFDKMTCTEIFKIIRASCSIPFITSIVPYQDLQLLDGGITAPIPIQQSISDGNRMNVIILTNSGEYQRKPRLLPLLTRQFYGRYKELGQAINNHHEVYNQTLDEIKQLEASKAAFVIRPSRTIQTKGMERNPLVLTSLYDQGYQDAEHNFSSMMNWLESGLSSIQ